MEYTSSDSGLGFCRTDGAIDLTERRAIVIPMVCLLLLAIATAVAYVPAMRAGFIWDDDALLTRNRAVKAPDGLVKIWTDPAYNIQYYPMTFSSFWIEHSLAGLNPASFHTTNVVLHILSAVTLFFVLRRIGLPGGVPSALFGAAIFALHPVHVESVAWISERKNVLSCLFYLLALGAYLSFNPLEDDEPARRRWFFYALSIVLFAGAVMSKTVTCSLPATIVLLLYWKRKRIAMKDILALAPMFAIGLGLALITISLERNVVGAQGASWDLSLLDRCLIAGRVICFYAGKLAWPYPLIFNYERWHIDAGQWIQYAFPAAVMALIIVLFAARRKCGKGPLVATLIFAGTLTPALGFFNVFPMRYSFVADHFQYHASIALISLCAAIYVLGVQRFFPRAKPVSIAIALCILATFGVLTNRHARDFHDLESLWTATLRKNDQSWLATNNMGALLRGRGELEAALGWYEKAIAINPDHIEGQLGRALTLLDLNRLDEAAAVLTGVLEDIPDLPAALVNLGAIRQKQGHVDQAVKHYLAAIAAQPDYPDANLNLGLLYSRDGKHEQAIAHLQKTLDHRPYDIRANLPMAKSLLRFGQVKPALECLGRHLQVSPNDAEAIYYSASAQLRVGRADLAIDYLGRAIEIDPNMVAAHVMLARIWAAWKEPLLRDGQRALQAATKAGELTNWEWPVAFDVLALAQAELGQFDQAVATATRGLKLAEQQGRTKLAADLRQRAALYKQRLPFRQR